jgi:hypothetical protein
VAKVSARALIGASFGSLAVGGTKPQRIGPRRFSPLTEMVSTTWLGATGMPVDFRELGHTEFLEDRLLGARARHAATHGVEALPAVRLTRS